MRVLVIDDSKAMRMIVKRELRAAADVHDVIEADNAVAAVELLNSERVDLVLSDWNMPGKTGIELLEWLRSQGWNGPLGFVTSEVGDATRARAFEAGAAFVLAKPFSGADLAEQIARTFGASATHNGLGPSGGDGDGPTVASVLQGLLRRPVSTAESEQPRLAVARALARYVDAGGAPAAACLAEISFAASAGAALSMLPPETASEWAQAGVLTEALTQNFYEVANVLAPVVRADRVRCKLAEVMVLADLEKPPPDLAGSGVDEVCLEVTIEGYEPGRVALLTLPGGSTTGAGA